MKSASGIHLRGSNRILPDFQKDPEVLSRMKNELLLDKLFSTCYDESRSKAVKENTSAIPAVQRRQSGLKAAPCRCR